MNSNVDLHSPAAQLELRKLIQHEKIQAQLKIFLKERKQLQDLVAEITQSDENSILHSVVPLMTDMSETVSQLIEKMGYKIPREVINNWFEGAYK